MTTTTNLTVANEIARQIGAKAFFMMGTRYKVGSDNALAFDVRGSRYANKVKVELNAMDTYDMTFYKVSQRGLKVVEVSKYGGVYADGMQQIIESVTRLRLSL